MNTDEGYKALSSIYHGFLNGGRRLFFPFQARIYKKFKPWKTFPQKGRFPIE